MENQILRDKNGNRIGEIKTEGSYIVIRDKNGNKLGHYDAKSNTTRDKNGNKVGSGNLLTSLL
jgi:hypothetical protein